MLLRELVSRFAGFFALIIIILAANIYSGNFKAVLTTLYDFRYLLIPLFILIIIVLFRVKIKGFLGEKTVSFFLGRLNKTKYKIINNIMLNLGDKTAQIDHIVVSNYGIFIIETKNYSGNIYGNDYDDKWTQRLGRKRYYFNNPLKQNYGHYMALKELLKEYDNLEFIEIVAFTLKSDLKVKTNKNVIYTVKLLKTIRKYQEEKITEEEKNQIYEKLLSLNVDNKENRKTHIKAIKDNILEKENSIRNNICPKCGGKLVGRSSKYGDFTGCSNYPKCRFIVK